MKQQDKIHNRYKQGAGTYDNLLSAESLWAKLAFIQKAMALFKGPWPYFN